MGSSCSLGQLDIYLNGLWLSALLHPVEDSDRNFPVVSGLHWQFLCRGYRFLDGCSNSLL